MDQTIAKVICLVILFVTTLIFGWLPYFIIKRGGMSPRAVHIRSQIISYLNCFAGGVFLGACLLHMLAEGRETMEDYFKDVGKDVDFPVYETLTAGGLFLIAAVEQVAHHFLHNKVDNYDGRGDVEVVPGNNTNQGQETNGFARDTHGKPVIHYNATDGTVSAATESNGGAHPVQHIQHTPPAPHDHQNEMVQVLHAMQANPLRAFLLLGALSFHTIFDGLAVGLKTTSADIWQMFAAIAIHKTLVALCLGLQLFIVYREKVYKAFLWIFFFSLISPVGVVIGIAVTSGSVDNLAETLTSGILQAIATGTFLYVTFFEILKEELIEKRGFLRLFVTIIGFGGMALAKALDKD
ncbi:protein zntD [Aplysia californica]|uniref:Protein zntD n=1 Tax=Aplysia californica TaxID=6500 RepID=A0ABM1A9Q0_APLCA|nr:protein zntD [Aplysia californica]